MEPNSDESVYQGLLAQGYSDEQIQAILELGGLNKQDANLDRQRKMAQRMRETPLHDGRTTNGVFTSAHPLELVGALGNQYRGQQALKQIDKAGAGLQDEMMRRRMEYLKGGRMTMPGYDPAPPVTPDPVTGGGFV